MRMYENPIKGQISTYKVNYLPILKEIRQKLTLSFLFLQSEEFRRQLHNIKTIPNLSGIRAKQEWGYFQPPKRESKFTIHKFPNK